LFFFQAEDGIRDFHVTGVQTCALPIFGEPEVGVVVPVLDGRLDYVGDVVVGEVRADLIWHFVGVWDRGVRCIGIQPEPRWYRMRSEERRVGKGGRTRWAARQRKQEDGE